MAYGNRNFGGGNRHQGNSYGGGRGSFGGNSRGGFGGGFNKPSFQVRCDDCGNSCTVPFKPNGSKPVLCSDCFRGSDNRSQDDRPRVRKSGPAPVGPGLKEEIQAINRKLDKILALLNDAVVESEEPDEIHFEDESESKEIE